MMPFEYVGDGRFKHRQDRHKSAGQRGFIAVDGEGVTDASGSHHYTMLVTSTDAYLQPRGSERSLGQFECFEFLVGLTRARSGGIIVGFSFNYDIEMMLKAVPIPQRRELHETNRTLLRDGPVKWYLERVPSKFFRLTRKEGDKKQTVTIWDVFGFFQMSFVEALKEWEITDAATIERIKAMKDKRATFQDSDSEAMLRYSQEECRLLVALMDKLYQTFLSVDIRLGRFDGVGAAAAALMRQYHVGEYLEESDRIALHAYFGGRFEVFRIGPCDTVYNADINSAYPHAAVTLPSGRGNTVFHDGFRSGPWSIYHCTWDVSAREQLMPFPHRNGSGRILYPTNGAGWYHGVEVQAAQRCYPGCITIDQTASFVPETDDRPFAFIPNLYTTRQAYKAAGDVRHRPLKLALNSLYGKLAQGVGYRGKRPPFQQYWLAGLITATTRAQLLEAAFPHRHNLVQLATDGIFALEQPEVSYGTALGQWERGEYQDFFSCQSGVYRGIRDGKPKARNRGFSTREINFGALQAAFDQQGIGASVCFEPTRFISFAGSHGRDYACWRQVARRLTVGCGQKFPSYDLPVTGVQRLLPGAPTELESRPYRPKRSGLDYDADLDHVEIPAENC